MFEKLKKIFKNREEKEKHNYDLTFDNVAIPEVIVLKVEGKSVERFTACVHIVCGDGGHDA